ncbi:MAG: TRAP transporter substrate-binding protein DctP, partial [Deltaproteobacteria bacterium]|nr:TRAP transporter substrate-binding protein DctP [Deltaproteobacteria bacterium]
YRDKINELSKGELEIKWLGGPEVIPTPALAEAVIKGRVDIAYNVGMLFADKIPGAAGIAFSPYTPMEERKNGIYEWLDGQFRKGNLHLLARGKTDMPFYTFTNFPVKALNDFKGKQIGGLDFSMGFFKALGASVVNVPKPDWYTSVQRGVVDGYMLPTGNMVNYKLQEITKYVVDHEINLNQEVIVINLKKWNSLPKHLQKLMTDVAVQLEYDIRDFFQKDTIRARKVMKDAGLKFLKLSPEEAKRYIEIFRDSVWKDFVKIAGPEIAAETKKVMFK